MSKYTQFEAQMMTNIFHYIRNAKLDGTVGMSVDNLLQCVRPPSNGLVGAPLGTNARYFYAQMFRNACKSPLIAPFIIS